MSPVSSRRLGGLCLLLLGLSGAEAGAQDGSACFVPGRSRQAVYVAGPNNTISCILDWSGITRAVVTSSGGTLFTGLSVRYKGEGPGGGVSLVSGSSTQGGDIQVFDCDDRGEACRLRGIAAVYSQPLGVSLNSYGDIASANGASVLYVRRCTTGDPLCGASGYATPVGPLPFTGAVDVRFVPNAARYVAGAAFNPANPADPEGEPGDVLVVSATQVLKVAAGNPDPAHFVPGLSTGSLGTPQLVATVPGGASGLAFVPGTGEFLVATADGRVLVYPRNPSPGCATVGGGAGCPRLFASLGGRKGVSVSIGPNSETSADPGDGSEVLVTTNANGTAQRFVARRNAQGHLVGTDLQYFATGTPPFGIDDASDTDTAFTPAGTNVTVLPTRNYRLLFEMVLQAGFTQSRSYLLEAFEATGAPLRTITGPMVGLPERLSDGSVFQRRIPTYVRPVLRQDGRWYYLVFVTASSADYYGGTLQHEIEELPEGFGGESCSALPLRSQPATPPPEPELRQPRTFYATDHDDAPVVEGSTFADVTSGCNSNIARGSELSLFLNGFDDRVLDDVVADKLQHLTLSLSAATPASAGGLAPFVRTGTLQRLNKQLSDAKAHYAARDYAASQASLDAMVSLVTGSPSAFVRCAQGICRNAPGQIVARAVSAAFMVCGADPANPACGKYRQ